MNLLTGKIGGNEFPKMIRGNFYEFSYVNMESPQTQPLVLNPLIVFSAIDTNRRIHALDIRLLRNPSVFFEDYKKFYCTGNELKKFAPEHKYAFSFRILKALFKRNPDIEDAWRVYNPIHMKSINHINIEEVNNKLTELNKVYINNMGVL
jgi:hypothetical protein